MHVQQDLEPRASEGNDVEETHDKSAALFAQNLLSVSLPAIPRLKKKEVPSWPLISSVSARVRDIVDLPVPAIPLSRNRGRHLHPTKQIFH